MHSLFAYGTLLEPTIWNAVAGTEAPSEPATLPGYQIRRVEGADFPGIIRSEFHDRVTGRIFRDLTDAMIDRLDAYEDAFYERRAVTLLDGKGLPVESQAYVVPAAHRHWLSDETWTLDWFRREAMDRYRRRHGFD